MTRHNKTGRSKRALSPFIAMERYMLESHAWQSLSLPARCALIEMLSIYNGRNNGCIGQSARMLAESLHISRATANRALRELTDKGFIEAVKAGGFSMKSGPRATEWRLTMHPCNVTNETRPSKKFMRWHKGKIHLAVPPEGQSGTTRGPVSVATQ